MLGAPKLSCYRDKDIPSMLASGVMGQAAGLVGSDVVMEQAPDYGERLAAEPLLALNGLRFALIARADKAAQTAAKLRAGEPVVVATSYPRLTGLIAQRRRMSLQVGAIIGGQIEQLVNDLPDLLDGGIDIVQTGRTLRLRNQRIVADNLFQIALCAMWPKANGSNQQPKSTVYSV
jgi:ATP phosphoribosyltransferase